MEFVRSEECGSRKVPFLEGAVDLVANNAKLSAATTRPRLGTWRDARPPIDFPSLSDSTRGFLTPSTSINVLEDNPFSFAQRLHKNTFLPFKSTRLCWRRDVGPEKGTWVKGSIGEMDSDNLITDARVKEFCEVGQE